MAFSDDLDAVIGDLGMRRVTFDGAVEKHLGSGRLMRAEDLVKLPAAEFRAKLPEIEAARRERRLLEGPLTGNTLNVYTEQLVRDGAPSMTEEEYAALSHAERTLRLPEFQASIRARTFKPRDGAGKTLAELDDERNPHVEARELYETEYTRMTFAERSALAGDIRDGRVVVRPGSRPKG